MTTIHACDASATGDLETLTRLLNMDIDVNEGDYDSRTCLHLSAANSCESVVKFLLEKGADVNVLDRWGVSPLDDAREPNII